MLQEVLPDQSTTELWLEPISYDMLEANDLLSKRHSFLRLDIFAHVDDMPPQWNTMNLCMLAFYLPIIAYMQHKLPAYLIPRINSDGLVQPRLGHATPSRRNQMALGLNRRLGLFCLTNCVYCDPMMHGSLFRAWRKYTFLVWPRFISSFLVWPDLSRVMSGMCWDVLRLRLAKTKIQDVRFLLGEAWGKLGVLVGGPEKTCRTNWWNPNPRGTFIARDFLWYLVPSWVKTAGGHLELFWVCQWADWTPTTWCRGTTGASKSVKGWCHLTAGPVKCVGFKAWTLEFQCAMGTGSGGFQNLAT